MFKMRLCRQRTGKQGEGRVNLPKDFENHAPIHEEKRWKSCWRSTESPVIRKMVLAPGKQLMLCIWIFPLAGIKWTRTESYQPL